MRAASEGACLKISIIVPTLNRKDSLLRTVRALLAQDLCPHEVIVVDNGSSDGTREALGGVASSRVKLVPEPVRGPAAARNRGVQAATGEVFAFIDDDAVPASDWLAVMSAFFASEPAALGVGGPTEAEWESEPPWYVRRSAKLRSYLGVLDLGPVRRPLSGFYDFLIGTNCAYRRSLFDSGMRFAQFGVGRPGTSEDIEFSRRAAAAGPVHYLPELRVVHRIAAYKYSPRYIASLVFDCGLKKPFIGRRISPRGAADLWGVDGALGLCSLAGYACGTLLKLSGRK